MLEKELTDREGRESAAVPQCPEHSYCVFCRTGTESETAELIGNDKECVVIIPKIEREECHSGVWKRITKNMLPGYIFIFSDDALELSDIRRRGGVIKLLRYDEEDYDLRGDDRNFAEWIYKNEGVIGVSTAVKEGTKIKVTGGPLLDYAGSIIEVKRQKRIAKVRITLGEITRDVWVSFEWLKEDENE